MIPLVNDNSPDAINASLIAVKRELQTLLDAIKKINPTQEIIEQGGGEITELTQSEYDALTPEQKADGTVRVISDSDQTPVDLAGLVIDDETVANNKTWSSEKIQNKTRDWTLVSGGSNTQKALPTDWRELIIVAYDNSTYTDENVCYQFHVTREMVSGKVHRFYSGYTYTTSDYGGARVDVTETTVTLQWFKFNGATKNALMTVRYR